MRLPPPPGSERQECVTAAAYGAKPRSASRSAHLTERLGELLRSEETGHPGVIQDLSLRGDEGDGGQPVHAEALVQRIQRILRVGAVHLDADEARGLRHDRRTDVGLAVELLAGGAR